MNIGQAAKKTSLSAKMIRYYESIDLLPAARRSDSGYRQYSQQDLHRLAFIKRSRDLGFSLAEISQLLALWQDRQRASADVKALAAAHIRELECKISELSGLRDTLKELMDSCQGTTARTARSSRIWNRVAAIRQITRRGMTLHPSTLCDPVVDEKSVNYAPRLTLQPQRLTVARMPSGVSIAAINPESRIALRLSRLRKCICPTTPAATPGNPRRNDRPIPARGFPAD